MSVGTRNPLRLVGGNVNSGFPNTGEVQMMRGGQQRAIVWSGNVLTNAAFGGVPGGVSSGGHVLIASGAGRLNVAFPHQGLQSGQPVFFYDASVLPPSGISVSGQFIVGLIPPVMPPYQVAGFQSGGGANPAWSWRYDFDAPFFSGLCAAVPSGTPGFTVLWTPETNPTLG